jgi:mono/diheme cytochrome c family protein
MRWCLVASFVLVSVGAAVVTAQQASEKAARATTPTTAVTFHKDVEPLLQKHCQTCHRPDTFAPMSLLTYEDARPWARSIKQRVAAREMPPWFADPQFGHFRNDRNLARVDTFAAWVDAAHRRARHRTHRGC